MDYMSYSGWRRRMVLAKRATSLYEALPNVDRGCKRPVNDSYLPYG